MKRMVAGTLLGLGLIGATPANAVMLGDALTCTASGFTCNRANAAVGNQAEFTLSGLLTSYTADFSTDYLILTSGLVSLPLSLGSTASFTFGDTTSPITGATLLSASGLAVSSAAPTVTVVNGMLKVDLGAIALIGTNQIRIALSSTPCDCGPGAVPEPATWTLGIVGFGLIGWRLRRTPAPVLIA